MVTTATYPVAPTVTRRIGTLLDVATVRDGIAWQDGKSLYDTYNCMKFGAQADFCAPNTKDFDQAAGWVNGFRFAAYGGVLCKAVGLDLGRMESEVQRVFEAGESTAVERGLMDTGFTENTDADYGWEAAEDVTPTGTVTPQRGLAELEAYAASVYVGVPTLHLPIVVASLLAQTEVIKVEGNTMTTKMGSKVVAGAGYDYPNNGPTGAAAAAGSKWLYATGEVLVLRGPAEVRQAIDQTENDVYVLGERAYVVAVDCFTAAVKVTL